MSKNFSVRWFDYEKQIWANIKIYEPESDTETWWVWIPRYAYKLRPDTSPKSVDIVFLQGTTDKYGDKTAARSVNTTTEYVVHPAFTNAPTSGGWDSELTGFWVAKLKFLSDLVRLPWVTCCQTGMRRGMAVREKC